MTQKYLFSFVEKVATLFLGAICSLIIAEIIPSIDYGKHATLYSLFLFSAVMNDAGVLGSINKLNINFTIVEKDTIEILIKRNSYLSILFFGIGGAIFIFLFKEINALLSVIFGILAVVFMSKSIYRQGLLTKKNNFKLLALISLFASALSLLLVLVMSCFYVGYSLGMLFFMSYYIIRYFLLKIFDEKINININDLEYGHIDFKCYSNKLMITGLTNSLFVLLLDFLFISNFDNKIMGSYKFALFIQSTVLYTLFSSVERIILNIKTDDEINNLGVRFITVGYILMILLIPIPWLLKNIDIFENVGILLNNNSYFIVLVSQILLPIEYYLLILFKKNARTMDFYSKLNTAMKLNFIIVLFLLVYVLKCSFTFVMIGFIVFSGVSILILVNYWLRKKHLE
jgi:hypothetical protein